ncbi:UDP-glucosyltransferase 2-like, partial [Condylostylus longicornis]|uniref:UDP-glucosyltransferase 2-like n=1 Tax=Condylostylus longicornis TaxID=2530218 RepID=UPI00244E58DE
MKLFLTFIITVILINFNSAANILGFMNVASPSHSIWNNVLVKGLAERGHNLTIIISDLPKDSNEIINNVTYFTVEEVYSGINEIVQIKDFFNLPAYKNPIEFHAYCIKNCEATLNSKEFNKFISTYDRSFKFDLVLYDFVCGPCLLGLLEYFNYPPLIAISPFPVLSFGNRFNGNHNYAGYISYFGASLNPVHNIFDRFYNNFLYLFEAFYRRYIFYRDLDQVARSKHFLKDIKFIGDLEKSVMISLVNTHPSVTSAQPIPPNVIEVGGLQITDVKPLPKNLENFITSGKKGAILFSLGTNVRPEDISDEYIDIFFTVIKNFPDYNFMLKFDETKIKLNMPKNLLIKRFFPQRDILAHPNTKLFITHCGGLSIQESIWHGVPFLGLSLFSDQVKNAKDAVQRGIAVQVEFFNLTKQTFEYGIREVLENDKYAKNIKLMSKQFRDTPMKPLETAIWWIEYILRHPNSDYLKLKSLQMNY